MKKKGLLKSKLSNIILIILISTINLYAQEAYKHSPPEVVKLFEKSQSLHSSDDDMINGCVYPLPNSRIKGQPYLEDQWSEAIFFINNKKYTNLLIKYDLIIDGVILKSVIDNEIDKLVNLNKFQIDSFIVGNFLFVNSRIFLPDDKMHTFFEQIYKGDYSLIKKYEKVFIKQYTNSTPYGKYSDIRTDLYLINNNNLINVNRKSLFIKNFKKDKQDEIKSFLKNNNIKYKKATQQQLNELMSFCSKLI